MAPCLGGDDLDILGAYVINAPSNHKLLNDFISRTNEVFFMPQYKKFKKAGPFHTEIAVLIVLALIMVLVFLFPRFNRERFSHLKV